MKRLIQVLTLAIGIVLLFNAPLWAFVGTEQVETFLAYLVLAIVVLLIVRELNCWYWKVNRAIALLEEISSKLDRDEAQMSEQVGDTNSRNESHEVTSCPNCGKENDLGMQFCRSCNCPLNWDED